MAKRTRFKPVKTEKGWQINIPKVYSVTGKRQRVYFPTQSRAKTQAKKLLVANENHGTGLRPMSPQRQQQAVLAFELPEKAGIAEELAAIVRRFIKEETQCKASVTMQDLFAKWEGEKIRKPIYIKRLSQLKNRCEGMHAIMVYSPGEFWPMPEGLIHFGEGGVLPDPFITKNCGDYALEQFDRLLAGLVERGAGFKTAAEIAARTP